MDNAWAHAFSFLQRTKLRVVTGCPFWQNGTCLFFFSWQTSTSYPFSDSCGTSISPVCPQTLKKYGHPNDRHSLFAASGLRFLSIIPTAFYALLRHFAARNRDHILLDSLVNIFGRFFASLSLCIEYRGRPGFCY